MVESKNLELNSKHKETQQLLMKCELELKDAKLVQTAKKKVPQNSEAQRADVYSTQGKLIYKWQQTDLKVGIEIHYALPDSGDLKYQFQRQRSQFSFPIEKGNNFELDLDLFAEIVPETSKAKVGLNQIEIIIDKIDKTLNWSNFQKEIEDLYQQIPTVQQASYLTSVSNLVFMLENANEFQKFKINPYRGQLAPESKINFTLTYAPLQAEVKVASIIMHIQFEQPRVIKVSGIGKYPFLQLNTKKLNFETLLIGKTVTKEFTIKNSSEAKSQFQITKMIDDEFKDNAFTFDYYSGVIPQKSTFLIKVTYKPQILKVSVIRFKVICQGGNELTFECVGSAVEHAVYLSEKSINFGEIKIGNQATKLLTIHNDSDLATSYQIYTDMNNIFGFNKIRGLIQGKSFDRIIVTFIPNNTINYYERVNCVASNQIKFVDLIGTCYPSSDYRLIKFSEDFIDFGYVECYQQSGARELELHNRLNQRVPIFTVSPETQSAQANSNIQKLAKKIIDSVKNNKESILNESFSNNNANLKLSQTGVTNKIQTLKKQILILQKLISIQKNMQPQLMIQIAHFIPKGKDKDKFDHSIISLINISITVDKETLFLRIIKKSSLNVELVNSFKQPPPPIHNAMAHPFQQLLGQIIIEVLTDSYTDQILKAQDQQPITLYQPEQEQKEGEEIQVEDLQKQIQVNSKRLQRLQNYVFGG